MTESYTVAVAFIGLAQNVINVPHLAEESTVNRDTGKASGNLMK
jgi:hypothetical protein